MLKPSAPLSKEPTVSLGVAYQSQVRQLKSLTLRLNVHQLW